ncbi:MAG: HAD family hydrolase [Chitinivibrionales bacterium]
MAICAIFGWDGVIVDSSWEHEQSWQRLAAEENRVLPEGYFQKGFGMKNELIIQQILDWTHDKAEVYRLSMRKEQIYREILSSSQVEVLPGVLPFLDMLHSLSIPTMIASSTHRANIDVVIQRLEIGGYFDGIVSGEDVVAGKPDPQVFLMAARHFECPVQNSVVFEDAPAGIVAAHRAGMKAVGVATTHPAYTLIDADIVVHRLDELNRFKLEDLYAHAQHI